MKLNDFPVDELAKALAALTAEREARQQARRADPNYDPAFILMHPAEDDNLVLVEAKRQHPGVRDFELIASRIQPIRSEMTTPQSLELDATAQLRAQPEMGFSGDTEIPTDQD